MSLSTLEALSPLDGRYSSQVTNLGLYFSEKALVMFRLKVEVEYLLFLADNSLAPQFTASQQKKLRAILDPARSTQIVTRIKAIENEINHDVKAVEYFLRETMQTLKLPSDEFLHFALTSEDINALAYSLALQSGLNKVVFPQLLEVLQVLTELSERYKAVPMLARTHGQPAVPTTLGKELLVFTSRLHQEMKRLFELPIEGKLSGAVGNFNAHMAAFPKKNWPKLSEAFIIKLGLTPAPVTTQILFPDSYIRIFQSLSLINSILLGLDQDAWRYISDQYLVQKTKDREVGSSTMPQKVNPIHFENSEGNLGLANALLEHFCQKLPISRLQRDLSDSTVKRNIGSALGYCCLGYTSCLKGLSRISANEKRLQEDLLNHWEVVAEGLQTILRRSGDGTAYEKLKNLTRGREVTQNTIKEFIDSLAVAESVKKELRALTPLTYTGLAETIVTQTLPEISTFIKRKKEAHGSPKK